MCCWKSKSARAYVTLNAFAHSCFAHGPGPTAPCCSIFRVAPIVPGSDPIFVIFAIRSAPGNQAAALSDAHVAALHCSPHHSRGAAASGPC